MKIHLGYEVGTGKAVEIPLRHLAVTGQTQLSGKTTTLEALISRSGLRAVAFKTKRAEGSFSDARTIPPYFRERSDWQFVTAVLEATLREKVKWERGSIIRACKATRTLADVHRNIQASMPKARGINQEILERLNAYLEIVIPQIESLPYQKELRLDAGLNVMDLRAYTMELQALVIRSVLEWAYERGDGVVVIIPEAWEFIPQQRGSPVLLACEELIRKGGAAKTFVWLDSQDIASVHKNVLRSVGVWLIGVQAERNEVKRALDHMPQAAPKPKPDDVMGLELGQFFVRFDKTLVKCYVQPAWLFDGEAARIATGKRPVSVAAGLKPEPTTQEDDDVWKEKYEQAEARSQKSEARIKELERQLLQVRRELDGLRKEKPPRQSEIPRAARNDAIPTPDSQLPTPDLNGFYQEFRRRVLNDAQVLDVLAERPEIEVRLLRPKLEVDGKSARGLCAQLIAEGFFNEAKNAYAGYVELTERRCKSIAKATYYSELEALAEIGFLVRSTDATRKVFYQAVEGMKCRIVES